jgi:preprotein translocase subunit YajC
MTFTLFAEDPPKQVPAENPLGIFGNPLFMIAALMLFFFVIMWPAQRRAKREQQQLLSAIKPGTKIVTSSGIIATVVKVKEGEDEITVKSEDTKLRILRSTVLRVLGDDPAESK